MSVLEVRFFDVGQGDCTFIRFPNGTTMLIDCKISEDSFLTILDELLPSDDDDNKVIDYLVITHPHEDHIIGIGKLGERYLIKNIWESGHRLYVEEKDQDKYTHYYNMLNLIQKVKRENGDHIKLTAYKELVIDDEPDVKILILSPTKAYLVEEKPTERDIHDQCVVLRVEYNGRSILFTGDSSMEAWKERIVPYYSDESGRPNLLDSTILHVSHHGSYTFYKPKGKSKDEAYTDAIEKIDPEIAIISVGKDNRHGHPDEDALGLYNKYTFNEQVYMTMDHGTIFVQIDENGNYTIETETMRNSVKRLTTGVVRIVTTPSSNEDNLHVIGAKLTFQAIITKKSSDQTINNIRWIVQNNAIGNDKHHNWYVGQYNNSRIYKNQTAYSGSHTLLCEVYNQRGRMFATKAIKVNVKS